MLAEKELQECQQKNHTNIGDNLNQILARVEQPFAKVETAIKRRVVTFATTTTSSPPPPPTHTLESGKTLNHAKNAQTNRDRAANERKELDVKSKLPLSKNNYSNNASDKEELCENAFIIRMPQLVNEYDALALEPITYAEHKNLLPIATEKDEKKLLYSSNTLGYIEFDTLYALSSLEEKLKCVELSWLSTCTYHFIGKYNCKGEYMVHRVYICSTLKSPNIAQKYDQPKDSNCYNLVMSSFPSFVIKKHVKFQEGEQCWLLPTTFPSANPKPRTVCCQEGEDDEDMAPSDTNNDYKVRSFLHVHYLIVARQCKVALVIIHLVPHVHVIIYL